MPTCSVEQGVCGPQENIDVENDNAAEGSAAGEPHLRTFDNLYYDFQGAGEFTLVRGDDLEIQIRTEPYGSSTRVTAISAVAMQVGDAVVGLYLDRSGEININGDFVELEVGETIAVDGGGIYRSGTNSYVVVNEHGDGFQVTVYNSYLNVYTFLCEDRAGEVSGLLGNADGDSSNDIALSDGTVLSGSGTVAATVLYTDYADSWRVTDETSLFIYEDGESTATYTIEDFPVGVITVDDLDPDVRAAAEAVALAAGLVEGTPEFDAAVLDVALTGDESFADGIAEYTDSDEEADVLVIQEAPEPVDDTAQTDEDTSVLIDVLANDTDPEGDALEIVSASDANGGTVEITDDGLRYTPPENFNGETTLTYEVSDGQGNTVSAEVTVTVAAVQDAPVAAADQFTTNEETPVSGNVLDDNGNGADTDVEGDSLTVVEVNGDDTAVGTQITLESGALLTLNENGSFSYDPNGQFDDLEDGQETTDSFEYTVSDGQGGTDTQTVTMTISGIDGLALDAGEDASQAEGTSFSRVITFSDGEDSGGEGWTYEINWGDGSDVETGATTETSFTISRDLADGDTGQTVTVTIYDGDQSVVDTFTIETTNVAPAIPLTGAAEVNEGDTYTITLGDVTDPGDDTVTSFIVNWGDGSQETIAAADIPADGQLAYIYTDGNATPTITVDLVDEDGTHLNAGSLDVTVNNVAPELAVSGEDEVYEGALYTLLLGDIVDPGDDTHSISIDWGDGSDIESVAVGAGSIDHIFSDGQSTAGIIVTVTDSDGDTGSTSKTVTVNNVAPAISIDGTDNTTAGETYTLTLGDVVDPGDDTVETYTIDWGDGTVNTIAAADLPTDNQLTHIYESPGEVSIQIGLTDEDDTYLAVDTLSVTVNEPAAGLWMNAGDDASQAEGTAFSRLITFSDGGDSGGDGWTYEINWGDGSDVETGTTTETSFTISRDLADGDASQTVTVTIYDGDQSIVDTFTLETTNVAPTISLTGAAEVNEGDIYTLTLGEVMDPGDDTVTNFIVNWGDGSDLETVLASDLPSDGVLPHTFENTGDYTISIGLSDEDGTYPDTATLTTTVTSQPNQNPVAHADAFTIDEAGILTANLLEDNGYGEDADPDGDDLSVVEINGSSANVGDLISLDSGALLTVTEEGGIEYDPNSRFDYLDSGETATDSFEYTVSDGNGGVDVQTATITISGSSDAIAMLLGDAPDRLPRDDRNAWINAWTNDDVTITHKADFQDNDEAWSDVLISGNGGSSLAGGDILSGDLGVSGTTGNDESAALQEVDGTEALRFELDGTASQVTLDLTRFYADDDGNGNSESIRLQAYDDEHNLVEEFVAIAESLSGDATLIFEVESGFSELVITSGAYDESGEFIYGALSDGTKNCSAVSDSDAGSDFMVESITFDYYPGDDEALELLGVAETATEALWG